MQDKRYDLAIVGAGFSGPILAAKIADTFVEKILIEATGGGDHTLTLRRFKEGGEKAREILERMGAGRITPPATLRMTPQTRGEHRVGSCRAGLDPETSVVNPYFESHNVENLLICDGSVIPRVSTGPSGTPQASVTVFAADRIIERHFS